MRNVTLTIAILFIFAFAVAGLCRDLYVDAVNGSNDNFGTSPEDAFRSITYALLMTDYGNFNPYPYNFQTIHVAPGVYDYKIGEIFPLKMKARVNLVGEDPETTVISANIDNNSWGSVQRSSSAVLCENVRDILIQGLTVKDGSEGIVCVNSTPRINNCIIEDNFCNSMFSLSQGGIYCNRASPKVTNCIIRNNHDGGWEGEGYGILLDDSSPLFINCLITENNISWIGDSIRITGDSSPKFVNCTIAHNYAYMGYVINSFSSGNPTFVNCIIFENISNDLGGGIPEIPKGLNISYSCVEGGYEGLTNISKNPVFVKGPLGKFYLTSADLGQGFDSPCIDTGTEIMIFGLDQMTTRTDGLPDSGRVDMGYHYPVQE